MVSTPFKIALTSSAALALVVAACVAAPSAAVAGTFTVTTGAASGPGSLRQAVLDANANPGPDVVTIGALTIRPELGPAPLQGGPIVITESVSIVGAGSTQTTIDDEETFLVGGQENPGGLTACDTNGNPQTILNLSGVVFQVGANGVDSSGVTADFTGFGATRTAGFVETLGGASVTMTDVWLRENRALSTENSPITCDQPLILSTGSLTIRESRIESNATHAPVTIFSQGPLLIDRSYIRDTQSNVDGDRASTLRQNAATTIANSYIAAQWPLDFTGTQVTVSDSLIKTATCPLLRAVDTAVTLRNATLSSPNPDDVDVCGEGPLPEAPEFLQYGSNLGMQRGTLDVTNTLIYNASLGEPLPSVVLYDTVVSRSSNNFVTNPASALILSALSGDAGVGNADLGIAGVPCYEFDELAVGQNQLHDCDPLAGSTLMGAGDNQFVVGSVDVAGRQRILGTNVDIGAAETGDAVTPIATPTPTPTSTDPAGVGGSADPELAASGETVSWRPLGAAIAALTLGILMLASSARRTRRN